MTETNPEMEEQLIRITAKEELTGEWLLGYREDPPTEKEIDEAVEREHERRRWEKERREKESGPGEEHEQKRAA